MEVGRCGCSGGYKLSETRSSSSKSISILLPSFNDFQDTLQQQFYVQQQVQQNMTDGNYEQLVINSQKLKEIVHKQKERFNHLLQNTKALSYNFQLKAPQKDNLNSEKSLNIYLLKIKKCIEDANLELEQVIEKRKNDLINKLTLIGIEVPIKIKHLTSITNLERFEQEFEQIIKVEEIFQNCAKNGVLISDITKLPPSQRLNIFQRLANVEGDDRLKNKLLDHTIHDKELQSNFKSEAIELILKLCTNFSGGSSPLPSGIWKTIKQLNNGKLAVLLEERDLLSQLEQFKFADISEFFSEYDGDVERLPDNLRLEMQILALENGKLSYRISELTSLFLKNPDKIKIAESLLDALLKNEQYEESLCLASLGCSMGWLQLNDDSLRDLIIMVMLERPDDDKKEQKKAIIEILLSDLSWITSELHATATLLYILTEYDLGDIYVNLTYQYPEEIRKAQDNYPELIGYFLKMLSGKSLSPCNDSAKESSTCKGSIALQRNFKHDLKKQSCYQRWETAKKYQRYFNNVLHNAFNQLHKSNELIKVEAIPLIEEAQKKLGLASPDPKRQFKMRQYVETQMRRLQVIHDSLSETTIEELENGQLDSFESLEKESSIYADDRIMRKIYHNIFEV